MTKLVNCSALSWLVLEELVAVFAVASWTSY